VMAWRPREPVLGITASEAAFGRKAAADNGRWG
jgi:hypothetical protein